MLVIQPTIFADQDRTIPHVVGSSTLKTYRGSRQRLLDCIDDRFGVVYAYTLRKL
jgi:hypothetical protein